jgi:hypothetical protein
MDLEISFSRRGKEFQDWCLKNAGRLKSKGILAVGLAVISNDLRSGAVGFTTPPGTAQWQTEGGKL